MEKEYVRDHKIIEKTEEEKETELILNIIKTKKELEEASKNFEYADGDLIDYYTYQIKANRAKLDYLIKDAKQHGLQLDMVDQIAMRHTKAM